MAHAKLIERDKTGRTILLKRVRLSFADSLQEASVPKKSEPGTKPTHSANVLIEKDQPGFDEKKAMIVEGLKAAAREFKKPEDWWAKLLENSPKQLCFRKGTSFANDETGEIYKGYENSLVIVGKGPSGGSKRPIIKDRHKRDVEVNDINDVCYNGSYADVSVSFYGTDKGGTARLTCSFEVIRSHQEGERMGGGGVGYSEDDFDDLEDDDDSFDQPSGGGSAAPAAASTESLFDI
ncbi:hypothetical protein RCCWILLIS_11 [Rhodobacter phage RcCWillis]|nr:hypothetical protein RCCWILLIS_11 [Rhodobacter phage RcCWillis]